jgi:hypothetical protein
MVFVEDGDMLPHLAILARFNLEGVGPLPMLLVPDLASAGQVFSAWSADCFITTSDSGRVAAATWLEWVHLFCDWLENYRVRMGAVHQTAILFVDSASTRGNLQALAVLREHNVLVFTLFPHLTHVLLPVDATGAGSFKSDFVL